MLTVERRRRQAWQKQWDHVDGPAGMMVDGDAMILDADSGLPALVQVTIPDLETQRLRAEIRAGHVKWSRGENRMSGLLYENATFGFRPRTPLRKIDACTAAHLNFEAADAYSEIVRIGEIADRLLAEHAPEAHAAQQAMTADILPDWRIGSTTWTSGIINNTAQLQYHTDSNNVPRSWSAMLVLRRYVRGGMLRVPEYDATLACPDNAILLFCGSSLLHGVTPFHIKPPDRERAYRYTLVYYAINRMKACLPCAEEAAYGRRARTAREDKALTL